MLILSWHISLNLTFQWLISLFISEIPTETLTETNTFAYAVAYVLTSKVCPPTYEYSPSTIPPWKVRLQNRVSMLRNELSQLDAAERIHTVSLNSKLASKYHVVERGLSVAKEDAKQRLLALSHRLKRYTARSEQYKQNNLFKNCPGKLYKSFQRPLSFSTDCLPDRQEVNQFWNNIWGVSRSHSVSTQWFSQLYSKHETLVQQPPVCISFDDIAFQVKHVANWKSPGLDHVPVYWLSLPAMWKLLSGIIARKMLKYLTVNKLLAFEQKGIQPGSKGTKDKLLIDKMIGTDCKSR